MKVTANDLRWFRFFLYDFFYAAPAVSNVGVAPSKNFPLPAFRDMRWQGVFRQLRKMRRMSRLSRLRRSIESIPRDLAAGGDLSLILLRYAWINERMQSRDVIPRNIFLMWDRPRREWPGVIEFCIDLWTKMNPGWNVEVFDLPMAREFVRSEIDADVFNDMKVQHQSDVLRTKLLSARGGIWVDASCFPHMPVDDWIGEFENGDLSALPTGKPGRAIASWFLVSKKSSVLMSKQYDAIVRYWTTPKMQLPQDPRAIATIENNWRDFVSEHAANTLRIVPYFFWHYLFTAQLETDADFASCFKEQKYLSAKGGMAVVMDMLLKNRGRNIPINPELSRFLATTDVMLSKLNQHLHDVDYPFAEMRAIVLARRGAAR